MKPNVSRRTFVRIASTGAAAIAFTPVAVGASSDTAFSIVPSSTVSGLGHVTQR